MREASEGGSAKPSLRRCTEVEPARFAEEFWGRQASLSRRAELPNAFDDLFDLTVADQLLSRQGLRTPFVRVAQDGTTLNSSRYTGGGGVGAGVADQVSDVHLAQLFADGATIVLQGLHRTHSPIIDFSQQLGAELGHPVQVNAYLTPPQSQGFSSHYDVHDVFVLQIAGEKRWQIHEPVLRAPLRDQPWTDHRVAVELAARGEPLIDEVLRPGDALYLPRGFLHSAVALGETSAHLTFGVHVWTRRHLLEQLLAASGESEELRSSLPLGIDVTDPDRLRDELTESASLFAQLLGTVPASTVAAGLVGAVMDAARAEPVRPLAQAAAAASLTPEDRVRWRAALRVGLSYQGEQLSVRTPDGVVLVPASAAETVERLRRGDVVRVSELAPGASGLELGRTLLRTCLAVLA